MSIEIHPHYPDIVQGVRFILLNNMPIQPIGIRLNGCNIDSKEHSIGSFKFHSKFRVLPKSDPAPITNYSYEPKLVSPIKQIIDQTKEEQMRINETTETSVVDLNMNITKPKRRAIKLARKNYIHILAYPAGSLIKSLPKDKVEDQDQDVNREEENFDEKGFQALT